MGQVLGGYVEPDPIGLSGVGADLYQFLINKPLILIDPWGLQGMAQMGTDLEGHKKWGGYAKTRGYKKRSYATEFSI